MKNNQTPDKITYSETRNVAFGDYESRTVFISLGCDLKPKSVEFRETASEEITESFETCLRRVSEKVMHALDKREIEIRKLVLDNGYEISGDSDSYEKKLINAQERVKAYKIKKEMKKAKG